MFAWPFHLAWIEHTRTTHIHTLIECHVVDICLVWMLTLVKNCDRQTIKIFSNLECDKKNCLSHTQIAVSHPFNRYRHANTLFLSLCMCVCVCVCVGMRKIRIHIIHSDIHSFFHSLARSIWLTQFYWLRKTKKKKKIYAGNAIVTWTKKWRRKTNNWI